MALPGSIRSLARWHGLAHLAVPPSCRDSARKTGLRARSYLPSPTYDHLFTLRFSDEMTARGLCLCVMRPGTSRYDADWFDEVPLSLDMKK